MTTLYGIKNCDSVKKARKWLDTHNIKYTFHDFRHEGINQDLINHWLTQQPFDKLINKRTTTWKQLDDKSKEQLNSNNAAVLCVEYPTLIKRPVLDHSNAITLGFNEATYSQIFNG